MGQQRNFLQIRSLQALHWVYLVGCHKVLIRIKLDNTQHTFFNLQRYWIQGFYKLYNCSISLEPCYVFEKPCYFRIETMIMGYLKDLKLANFKPKTPNTPLVSFNKLSAQALIICFLLIDSTLKMVQNFNVSSWFCFWPQPWLFQFESHHIFCNSPQCISYSWKRILHAGYASSISYSPLRTDKHRCLRRDTCLKLS